MATETERKFLVKGEYKHLAIKKITIIQCYLSTEPDKTIRIRITGEKAYLTVKGRVSGKSFARSEWEYEIPVNDAREIMKICLPGTVEKTRYLVPWGKHVFEVDEFHGNNDGLIIAELELISESEEFDKPPWLGDEVTGNPEYYNANLLK